MTAVPRHAANDSKKTQNIKPEKIMSSTLHQNIGSLALGLLCASMLISPRTVAAPANGKSPAIFPPHSHAHGQSMADWLLDHTRWKGAGFPESGRLINATLL
ncbi:MAG TPA: hypothetical protein VFZ59_12480 [Verrucomicrobiae bacterium]|nr:hypothetical protein [Verrucomicrobiae bacterium]